MNTSANEVSVRVLAGFLSVIMTFLMFLPMRAAFGDAATDVSGHYTGNMEIQSELGDTTSHPAVAVFQQSGRAVTGTIGFSAARQSPIRDGKVRGEAVSFSVLLDGGAPLQFQLTAKGDGLSGNARAKAQFGRIHATVHLTREP